MPHCRGLPPAPAPHRFGLSWQHSCPPHSPQSIIRGPPANETCASHGRWGLARTRFARSAQTLCGQAAGWGCGSCTTGTSSAPCNKSPVSCPQFRRWHFVNCWGAPHRPRRCAGRTPSSAAAAAAGPMHGILPRAAHKTAKCGRGLCGTRASNKNRFYAHHPAQEFLKIRPSTSSWSSPPTCQNSPLATGFHSCFRGSARLPHGRYTGTAYKTAASSAHQSSGSPPRCSIRCKRCWGTAV
ncbi:hypothetical protein SDC9_147763 [bioreactor metagenome]|uniref:Uncharacterized protein n=1 Tax=bioreactor metagenome TaxID=1076179 RepID=A0A645EFL1_9ZZZZ